MLLHFDRRNVAALILHSEAATKQRPLYSGTPQKPVLWIVGDDGIYLLSGGAGNLPPPCYARECDPTTMDFDEWWGVKNQVWGGSDGIETFETADIKTALETYCPADDSLIIQVTGEGIGLVAYRTVLKPRPAVAQILRKQRDRKA